MATAGVALSQRTALPPLRLRLLHSWHLFSLDAPSVAFCWTVLFAHAAHLPHAWPAALALACAVWVVYAGDRVLDAARASTAERIQSPLADFYTRHATAMLSACCAVAAITAAQLAELPHALRCGWLLLTLPLLVYALLVHRAGMPGRMKPWCVGAFFAAAVSLPVFLHPGTLRLSWMLAACAFGALCLSNCRLLHAVSRRAWLASAVAASALTAGAMCLPLTRTVGMACAAALGLLCMLRGVQARLEPLTFRCLADAALLLPVLLLLLGRNWA